MDDEILEDGEGDRGLFVVDDLRREAIHSRKTVDVSKSIFFHSKK